MDPQPLKFLQRLLVCFPNIHFTLSLVFFEKLGAVCTHNREIETNVRINLSPRNCHNQQSLWKGQRGDREPALPQ